MPGNLQSVPASVVASWPAPNFVNPVRRSWLPAYAGVLQAVMTVMLGTRLWLRSQRKAGALGLDDAVLIPGFIAATVFTALIIYGAEHCGLDRHIWDVQPRIVETTMFTGWLAELAFFVSTCCTKASVLLFYRRLAEGTINRRWRVAILGAIAFIAAYGVAFVFALIFNCSPTDAYWKAYSIGYDSSYHCTDTTVLNPLSGTFSVVTDLYSVVLPVLMLWNIEATRMQKLALNAVFSLGLLVVGAGIARTYFLQKLGTQYDLTWIAFNVYAWAQLEIQLAIICASAPALRVFFRHYLSDPLNRAIQSTRSVSARSTQRGSNQVDFAHFVRVNSQHSTNNQPWHGGDEGIVMKSFNPAVRRLDDDRLDPASAPNSPEKIITSARDDGGKGVASAFTEKRRLSSFYFED